MHRMVQGRLVSHHCMHAQHAFHPIQLPAQHTPARDVLTIEFSAQLEVKSCLQQQIFRTWCGESSTSISAFICTAQKLRGSLECACREH